jgi:hypothetical protein
MESGGEPLCKSLVLQAGSRRLPGTAPRIVALPAALNQQLPGTDALEEGFGLGHSREPPANIR